MCVCLVCVCIAQANKLFSIYLSGPQTDNQGALGPLTNDQGAPGPLTDNQGAQGPPGLLSDDQGPQSHN